MKKIERESIVFDSGGQWCSGWYYRALQERAACVVLAHGFASVKEMGLDAYAERFHQAGYHVLVFDYRYFGESQGLPRQMLDIRSQIKDWHAAVAFARSIPGVDEKKIVLWGTSLSGGHVAHVASRDPDIAAVISQVPHMSGLASALLQGPRQMIRLSFAAFADYMGRAFGRSPRYIDIFGPEGALAAMTGPGEFEGAERLFPDGIAVDRRVAARFAFPLLGYSPGRRAGKVRAPWLVQVALKDITVPSVPAMKAAQAAPEATLMTYDHGHFDSYVGQGFDRFVRDQLTFLALQLS